MVSGAGFLGHGQLLVSQASAAAAHVHVTCRHAFKGRALHVQRMHKQQHGASAGDNIEDAASATSHEENAEVHIITPDEPHNTIVGFQIPPAAMDTFTKDWLHRTFNKESMSSDERAALHRAKMKEFRGAGQFDHFWNPIFKILWAPWAESVHYIHPRDPQAVFDTEGTCTSRRHIAMKLSSYAIPTLPVLQYMVSKAPDGKIAEIGSGLGYWASLLQILGADVVAVDDFSEIGERKPIVKTVQMDGVEFIKQGGTDGRALFLCWPRMKPFNLAANLDQPSDQDCFCLAEACLEAYKGHTVFFVGEKDGGCTYDVDEWMENHRKMGWRLATEIEIPCWSGVHDSFMCFMKHEES